VAGQRGKVKQSVARNLLDRLRDHREAFAAKTAQKLSATSVVTSLLLEKMGNQCWLRLSWHFPVRLFAQLF
jgi:hypothetical protein